MSYPPKDDMPMSYRIEEYVRKAGFDNIFQTIAAGQYFNFPLTMDFAEIAYSGKPPEEVRDNAFEKIQEMRRIFDEKGDANYASLYKGIVNKSLSDAEYYVQRGLPLDALTDIFAAERFFMYSKGWTIPQASHACETHAASGTQAGSA